MKVKELIRQLLDLDMNADVALVANSRPAPPHSLVVSGIVDVSEDSWLLVGKPMPPAGSTIQYADLLVSQDLCARMGG